MKGLNQLEIPVGFIDRKIPILEYIRSYFNE